MRPPIYTAGFKGREAFEGHARQVIPIFHNDRTGNAGLGAAKLSSQIN